MDIENEEYGDQGFLSIQEMLDSGDPTLIEYAKSQQADAAQPTDESAENTDATQGVEVDDTDNDTTVIDDEHAQQAESDPDTNPEQEQPIDGVYAKDGKNIMPFSVVEQARREAQEARQQLQQLQEQQAQQQATHDKLTRQFELAREKGVELPVLPEDEQLTDEQIAELEDIGPEFGILARQMRLMSQKLQATGQQVDAAQSAVDTQQTTHTTPSHGPEFYESQAAVTRNAAIQEILGDPNMKAMAVQIEASLLNDPQYASLDARYAEVAKRVGGALGIDFGQKYGQHTVTAHQKAPNSVPATPQSMSDMPNADFAQTGTTATEAYAGQSDAQLHESLTNMSQAQIEQMMGEL